MGVEENGEIQKLLRKAELTRYMHGRLAERLGLQRKVLQVAIAVLGMLVSILAAVYYRSGGEPDIQVGSGHEQPGSGYGEVLLLILIILPLLTTTLVILDATVWQFREREEKHKAAVGVWGDWIRKAHQQKSADLSELSSDSIQKKYRKCMKATPNTPMSEFIRYKKEWIKYRNESIRLDEEQPVCVNRANRRSGLRNGERPK